MRVKVDKKDAVWLYHIAEAHEGIVLHRTCDTGDDRFREVELLTTPSFVAEVKDMLVSLGIPYEITK